MVLKIGTHTTNLHEMRMKTRKSLNSFPLTFFLSHQERGKKEERGLRMTLAVSDEILMWNSAVQVNDFIIRYMSHDLVVGGFKENILLIPFRI